jgi:ubiquinone/menaquinone biosynthesis C-methylase UbiE
MSAQDRTLDQYQELMNINAVSHLIRAGRQTGILDALQEGQRTAVQLCDALSLTPQPAQRLLDALVAIGIVEQYQDDYALSQAARLLCQYDRDLGDSQWERVVPLTTAPDLRQRNDDQAFLDAVAATQWIHTPAAIQAAEILDIGGEDQTGGLKILDLGCGSAVWSCAMAHRDGEAFLTLVDHAGSLEAAATTASSIGLGERIELIKADPESAPLEDSAFDLALLAQRLGPLDDSRAGRLLARGVAAVKPGGRLVVIDPFRGPNRPDLAETLAALRLELGTTGGRIRTLAEAKEQLQQQGLVDVQFTFLAASRTSLGLVVGRRPA